MQASSNVPLLIGIHVCLMPCLLGLRCVVDQMFLSPRQGIVLKLVAPYLTVFGQNVFVLEELKYLPTP